MGRPRMTRREQEEREEIMKVFGARILEQVGEKGMSETALAKVLCISRNSIYLWTGGYMLPSIQRLVRISRYFGVSVDYLLGLDDVKNRKEGV